jgi:hypothetical protein
MSKRLVVLAKRLASPVIQHPRIAAVGAVLLSPLSAFASGPTIVPTPTELTPTVILPQMASAISPWIVGALGIIATLWAVMIVKRAIFHRGAQAAS